MALPETHARLLARPGHLDLSSGPNMLDLASFSEAVGNAGAQAQFYVAFLAVCVFLSCYTWFQIVWNSQVAFFVLFAEVWMCELVRKFPFPDG